MAKNELIDF